MTMNPAWDLATPPWFHRWPRLATATAATLFAAVFVVCLLLPEEEAVTALFIFPIALIATARGMRAGLAAGLVALVLGAVGLLLADASLPAAGWAVRIVTWLSVGALLGRAADKLVHAERQRRSYELATQRQHQAVEVNDTLIQGMTAAKWAFEAGRVEAGLDTLTDTIVLGQGLVSELIRQNEPSRRRPVEARPQAHRQQP
jgi:hypothetical protein